MQSSPTTTSSSGSPKRAHKDIHVQYNPKGYGLFFAILINIGFFYLTPQIFKAIWPSFLKNFSREQIFIGLGIAIHTGVNVICNFCMYLIYTRKIPFFERYRISNKPWPWESNREEWNQLLKKTAKLLFIDHLVIVPIAWILEASKTKMRTDLDSFPGLFEIIWQLAFFIFCEDFVFYWSHRLFHHPIIYPYIHKKHHEYNISISCASEYTHPIEFIFGNMVATAFGSWILKGQVHFVTYNIWNIYRLVEAVNGHCGYNFSWSPYRLLPFNESATYHDFHHSNNKGNYGSFTRIWDTLCGTNSAYFNYLAQKKKKETELDK